MCDLAYLELCEQRERRATAVLTALIARGERVDMWAALEDSRRRFDEMLTADPAGANGGMDDDELELRRILGVG